MEDFDPEDYLELKNQSRLYGLLKKRLYFLRKLTLLFGASGTGKSTILEDILDLCKNHIPCAFAIAPTNSSNNMYTGKLPERAIKDGADPKKTVAWLESVIVRQKHVAELYNHCNDIQNLKPLFDMISNENERLVEATINKGARKRLHHLNSDGSVNMAKKKTQRRKIANTQKKTLIKLYKTAINVNRSALGAKHLSAPQKVTLQFLNIIPDLLLIFDDCASQFKVWSKLSTVIKDLFYAGRNYFITTIITTQDDKEIDSSLRKNSMVSIFTTDQIAISNFTRKSNGYPKFIADKSKMCIERVFKRDDDGEEHYRKLVYINNLSDPFRYYLADLHDDFQVGCKSFWALNSKMSKGKKQGIESNPFFQRFS